VVAEDADEFEDGDALAEFGGWVDEDFLGAFEEAGGDIAGEMHVSLLEEKIFGFGNRKRERSAAGGLPLVLL
jgi:hypothetical protein